MAKLRDALLFGACCSIRSSDAFTAPAKTSSSTSTAWTRTVTGSSTRKRRNNITILHRNSNGFVGFSGEERPVREYNDRPMGGGDSYSAMRNLVNSSPNQSNPLARRGGGREGRSNSSYGSNRQSVNENEAYDYSSRYSQPPHPSMMAQPHMQQQTRGFDGRIQGGSRHTYANDPYGDPYGGPGRRTFVETDGRPLNVEMEVWDGPNNSPTKVKMYSEDGRSRPMNILTDGGGMTSVRNVGSMEFPMRASVSGNSGGMGGPMGMMGGMGMMGPQGNMGGHGAPMGMPSPGQGENVQGKSLKTFTLPTYARAAQVTITSDCGLPVEAKVELWGTGTNVKQVAEVYNDNGSSRPFSAIIDLDGEGSSGRGSESTIAVRNTGPMEYPIRVVVEPISGGGMGGDMGMGGMGGMDMDMDGMMMQGGYGGPPPMGMMGGGGYGPPPPMMGPMGGPPPFF